MFSFICEIFSEYHKTARYWNLLDPKNHAKKIFNYIKSSCVVFWDKKCSYFPILYCRRVLKTFRLFLTPFKLISKNGIYFFFLIFWHAPITPSFRMLCYRYSFFALLALLRQAKSLTWIIVSVLSSSKLSASSRLTLSWFTSRILISLTKNVTSLKPSSKKSISS